ncbi:hypothetical protein RHGRI_031184 [Rhododendron griersonianum]|uniref:Aminotransferase-like plant mobile domain-containing protein n=1 Tax=Rhododendron griersonianum TaxID=479676 RepID=A0AAV6IAT1_9ERIC|nr:hypothetical protein RHGRI_031184 [Rhododendron griersonianum]
MKVYSIMPADVGKALGLPLGIVPVSTNCENVHFEHIRAMFAAGDEQLKRGVTFGMMKEVFESGVADTKFQTSYVLFVLSSLLCPMTKDVASTKFYLAVYDLTKISSYAWSQFVLDWLVKVITKFEEKDGKEVDMKKDALGVSGCVLLLMLIYFDKEEMGMNVGTGVPLIQSWTMILIMERIAKEENLDLVDPIPSQFPQPRLLHPVRKPHLKSFIEQMQHIIIMDASLMAHVSKTTTQKIPSKGKDVREMDSPLDNYACHEFPSSSTCTPKKAGKGIGTDEMDEDRSTGFENVQNARDMPLYTPEHIMDDVVHTSTSIMDKCGSHTGVPIDQHKLNMEEEVQVQEEVVVEMEGKVDGEGEQVQVQIQVDEGVVEDRALTRPSKKQGNRTVKASKATRTPYVAEPEVTESMIVWLMKEEKEKSPKKYGVPIPTRHMFSSTFVDNLRNIQKLKKQNVLTDRVDPNILGYDVAICNLASLTISLFMFINLFDCGFYTLRFMEHWTGGRMNTRELEANMGMDMRKRLLVRFILSPHKKRRDDVLQKCR